MRAMRMPFPDEAGLRYNQFLLVRNQNSIYTRMYCYGLGVRNYSNLTEM